MQFLERPGCHLCADAWLLVVSLFPDAESVVTRLDIESSDDLVRDYGLRIPVLLDASGKVLAEGRFDVRSLRRSLRQR